MMPVTLIGTFESQRRGELRLLCRPQCSFAEERVAVGCGRRDDAALLVDEDLNRYAAGETHTQSRLRVRRLGQECRLAVHYAYISRSAVDGWRRYVAIRLVNLWLRSFLWAEGLNRRPAFNAVRPADIASRPVIVHCAELDNAIRPRRNIRGNNADLVRHDVRLINA